MLTQSDVERERYEARLKFRRDEFARLQDAREEGEKRGEERGVLLGRVQVCERLLKQEPMPQEALQGLTLEQLRELADRLETQLLGRG